MTAHAEQQESRATGEHVLRPGLRLAHVTATFPPYKGGTGNVAWHLTRELASRGQDVQVLTADLGGEPTAPDGVQVHRLRPLFRVGNAPALPALFTALRPFDLIHLHYPFFFGAELVWAASRAFGIPYVITYHNDVRLGGALTPVPHLYNRIAGNRILSDASALLFTTLDYAHASDASHLVRRRTSVELPLGVDAERFAPCTDDDSLRASFGIRAQDPIVLFVGSLDRAHYFKGLRVLLEAAHLLQELRTHVVVVGDGDLRSTYEANAQALGLADRVHFAGSVSDSLLPRLYALGDMLVLPSVARGEAFGLVLLEAMASHRPVIATNLPGVRAVVQGTGGGTLVPPNDPVSLAESIRHLARAPGVRASLAQAGRRAVEERYTWHAVVDRLQAIYSEVTATS